MKINLQELQKRIDDGLIQTQKHIVYPLTIYNYTRECAFERKWDEYTIMCRGLILNNEGEVVALPFPKFFNLEELTDDQIPLGEDFEIFEKMDGSLGIIFYYDNKWHVATRGSFNSDQAIKGKEMLDKLETKHLIPGYTYLTEIIYPENRIVVDYGGAEKLVFLTSFENYTGEENDIQELEEYGFTIVPSYNGITNFRELKQKIRPDCEGFVIRFSPSGFRMKIKGEEYIKLHKLMTGISNKDIWGYLSKGTEADLHELLMVVPDEMDEWVRKTIQSLRYEYMVIDEYANKLFYGEHEDAYEIFNNDKAKFAEWVKKLDKYVQPILFNIWNKKPYNQIIWKYVKPKYSKPYFNQTQETE